MDRLITLEPRHGVAIRLEPGQKKYAGELTLRNVMHTMPVAFRLQPVDGSRYSIRPQSGIIPPLAALTLEITFLLATLPDSLPESTDSFRLYSVVVPGAALKDPSSAVDSVPSDWFATRKKQVFVDSGIRVYFVGSVVLTRLALEGAVDSVRDVLDRSNPAWKSVDSVDSHGQTLLHIAIAKSRPDLVQVLLDFKPDLEKPNRAGRTPMEAAAASGDALIVELLLSRKASTERSSGSAWGPLHHAAAGGHVEVLRLLILKGAAVDAQTSDGRTALHLAAAERQHDCARLLIASGARTGVFGGADGGTPLHVAAACGDEELARVLLEKGDAGTKEARNRHGRTAYECAVEGGHVRLFDALRLGDGLCEAARKGEGKGVARAVERGAAVNGRDLNGWTALMRAGFKGKVEVMKALMEMGAEVDAKDGEGYTALHCAVEAGQVDAVELLMKRGADVEAVTAKGTTAMEIAESLGYVGIVRILKQGGREEKERERKVGGAVGRNAAVPVV